MPEDPIDIPKIHVEIQLGEETIRREVNDDLRLDPTNLDDALIKQPAVYAYYSSLTQKANLLAAQAKFEYEKAVAEYTKTAREELATSNSRVTDKQIGAIIDSQPEILAKKKLMIMAEHNAEMLWSIVKALEHRKECLMQLCNNRRKEMEHLGLRVMGAKPKGQPAIGIEE